MPPVFGPLSPSAERLKSWAGASGDDRGAVAEAQQRELGSAHPLLDDDAAPGLAERLARTAGPHVVLGLGPATR